MKSIYLANPYGFSLQQKELLLPIIDKLESLGVTVVEPFSANNQVDFASPGWAYEVGQRDVNDVKQCDAIFAIINGEPLDVGVAVELGLAMAWGKRIFLFRDDFRRCSDSEEYPVNLMVFAGLPKDSWKDYYYTSVESITSEDKALVRWLRYSDLDVVDSWL